MKAATGELSLTVITIVAIGAVIAFFWLLWDNVIKPKITNSFNDTETEHEEKWPAMKDTDSNSISVGEYTFTI